MTNLTDLQAKVFEAWKECDEDYSVLSFATVSKRSGVDRSHIRRVVRALARKGYLTFCQTSWSDMGEPHGAGYGLTRQGAEYWKERS